MAAQLARISSKFLLSINDGREICEIFDCFRLEPVILKYTVAKAGATQAQELCISNYEIGNRLL